MHIQSSFYLLLLILNKQGSLLQHVDKFSSVLQTLVSMFNVYFFFKTGKMIWNAYCVLCEFPSTHIVFIFLSLFFFSKNFEEEKNKKLLKPDIEYW